MRFTTIFHILGTLLMIFSLSMLPPAGVGLFFKDGAVYPFIISFVLTLSTGFIVWSSTRKSQYELKSRDGFLIVTVFWFVLSFFGSIPLILATHPHLNFTNAMFESVSGLTTTGSTILTGIDSLPHAIRFYRQELQFLGGMGIIVLAVAILPMLGIGGMQLYRAETPGPMKEAKLKPRLAETAKSLWYIYLGLTIACILAYWSAGMTLFDAIGEAFSTVSTGGFSMHDASFSYYNNYKIDFIAIIFMILGATNFSLHYLALQRRNLLIYWKDIEFRTFIYWILFITFVTGTVLLYHHTYPTISMSIVKGLFDTVSIMTTTGLVSGNFQLWPSFIPYLILFAGLIGGCAASTSGGIKVVRALLMYKQSQRELQRLIHPKAVISIKFGKQILPEDIIQAMWGFLATFITLFIVLLMCLLADGVDLHPAVGALVGSIANVGAGIGIGDITQSFTSLHNFSKWVLIFAMLAGRLEIFTLLVLFTPAFWKR